MRRKWIAQFLPRSRSKGVFVFAMLCYSIILTEIGAGLTRLAGWSPTRLVPDETVPRHIRPGVDDGNLLDLLVIAPIGESLTLIAIIELLRLLRFGVAVQVTAAALAMFLLHAIDHISWATFLVPAFLIDAGTYLYGRRISFWVGAQMVLALHFLFNCFPAMLVLAERWGR